jgi:hypothetical protein
MTTAEPTTLVAPVIEQQTEPTDRSWAELAKSRAAIPTEKKIGM